MKYGHHYFLESSQWHEWNWNRPSLFPNGWKYTGKPIDEIEIIKVFSLWQQWNLCTWEGQVTGDTSETETGRHYFLMGENTRESRLTKSSFFPHRTGVKIQTMNRHHRFETDIIISSEVKIHGKAAIKNRNLCFLMTGVKMFGTDHYLLNWVKIHGEANWNRRHDFLKADVTIHGKAPIRQT